MAVHERVCVPVVAHWLTLVQAPQASHEGPPHDAPDVDRVQLRESMRGTDTQAPPEHIASMQVRVSLPPDSAQTLGKSPQAPYAPHVVIPHEMPSLGPCAQPVELQVSVVQIWSSSHAVSFG